MNRLTRLRPSRAMAVAFAALFVALAGTATAAKVIDGGDIKNNSVTGKDVKDGSLVRKDFKRGQLPAGARGLQGAQGPAGPSGRAGRDGFGRLAYVFGEGVSTEAVEQIADVAFCPAGTNVVGGGVLASSENPGDMAVNSSIPNGENGWIGWVDNLTVPAGEEDFRGALAFAICANANTVTPFPELKGQKSKLQKFLR